MGKDAARYTLTVPNGLKRKMTSTVRFRIFERMVQRFEDLIGDHSPLHSSEDFARRSVYRQQVVHGMLPIGFISIIDFFHIDNLMCSPVEISGQFVEPVYIGDELCLRGEVVDIDEENALVKCNYSIEKVKIGATAVKGTIDVRYLHTEKNEKGPSQPGSIHHSSAMITEPLHLRDLRLEEISLKNRDGFPFTVSEDSINALIKILLEGISEENRFDPVAVRKQFLYPDLLSTMLFSTSVGMCIPGKYATFLGFDMSIDKPVDINTPYVLKSEVVHVSRSTRIIKKNIFVHHTDNENEIHLTGKVSILVNSPPVKMPTIRELKESALDIGLKDRVVLITGASRGIGETIAKLFALFGAKVIVNYFRGEKDAKRIVNAIMGDGGDAVEVQSDVSDPLQVQRMVQTAVERYGTVNLLVNNAVRDFKTIDFSRLTWEDIQKDIDVVVKGAFNCCKEVIPLMLDQGGGKIINIGTVATDNPPPNQVKYVVSKCGLVGLTRSLSIEFAAKNIQINMVVPNFVETDLVSHIPNVYKKKIAQDTPMHRNASPIDVAQAVIFLASSYSSFTTGQKIMVTGGGAPYL